MTNIRILAFVLLPSLLASLYSLATSAADGDELVHEIEPGYASSYLPLKSGPLVNEKFQYQLPLMEDEARTLAERFDMARQRTLIASGEEFIPLADFLKDIGFDPKAQNWEGKCHQWAAAATDNNVKALLKDSKGLICQGIILEKKDLKELFTALYPSRSQVFLGKRAKLAPGQDEDMFQMDTLMESSLGLNDFSPEVFHEQAHALLEKKQGFILDMDPLLEVWNHPVFKVTSKTKTVPHDLSALNPEQDLMVPLLPPELLLATTEESQKALAEIKEIDQIFRHLLQMPHKKKSDKVLDLLGQRGFAPTLMKELMASHEQEELGAVIGQLFFKKMENYETALKNGAKILPHLQVKLIESEVDYLTETGYREDGLPQNKRVFSYIFVEDHRNPSSPQRILSRWNDSFFGGDKPDFLWVPVCQTETCHQRAAHYKRGRLFQQMGRWQRRNQEEVGLILGLSDLLKLFQKCYPLDEGINLVRDFISKLEGLKQEGHKAREWPEETRASLQEQWKRLQSSQIPLKLSSLSETYSHDLGLGIGPEGDLTFGP